MTAVKMAGALNSLAYGRTHHESGFIIANLKRILDHLHKTQSYLDAIKDK